MDLLSQLKLVASGIQVTDRHNNTRLPLQVSPPPATAASKPSPSTKSVSLVVYLGGLPKSSQDPHSLQKRSARNYLKLIYAIGHVPGVYKRWIEQVREFQSACISVSSLSILLYFLALHSLQLFCLLVPLTNPSRSATIFQRPNSKADTIQANQNTNAAQMTKAHCDSFRCLSCPRNMPSIYMAVSLSFLGRACLRFG